MLYDNTKNELRKQLSDYAQRNLQPSPKAGKNAYVCPECGSGTGPNGTGAFFIFGTNSEQWKCHSCGAHGDIFDLYGIVNGISDKGECFRGVAALYGNGSAPVNPTSTRARKTGKEPKQEQDYTDYFEECRVHIKETDYPQRRGLSPAVVERFGLGFDKAYDKSLGGAVWQALIIPTGKSSYVARNTDMNATGNNRFRKEGSVQIYNMEALTAAKTPIFITESEIDALSIMTVSGEAVSIGSTGGIDRFIRLLKEQPPAQPLIIALDNDEAGHKAADQLSARLEELNIVSYRPELFGKCKDANAALLEDEEAFAAAIENAEHIEDAAIQVEKELYLQSSAGRHLQGFIDGITESINTPYIKTGFEQLDAVLDGGLYEGLYIIGSITSNGKTTSALQMLDQMAQNGQDVIVFSMEMARNELISKSISRHTITRVLETGGNTRDAKTARGITTGTRYAHYNEKEHELIREAVNDYRQYADNIYIVEGLGDIGVSRIRETVKNHILFTGNKPVVFVDYLQILAPHSERMSDKQNTDKAVLELKRISRDFKIPVFCVSSLNRANYNAPISMEAFKESGAIEYSSDVLLGLQLKGTGEKDFDVKAAKAQNPREMELIILKNRNGATGGVIEFKYYALFSYFAETYPNQMDFNRAGKQRAKGSI